MHVGKIKKLVAGRGYGSIKAKSGEDAHFHKHCLWGTRFEDLAEGQKVEFEMQPSYKGFIAFQIRPLLEKNPVLKAKKQRRPKCQKG